jgi:hypothetical protein
MVKPDRELYEPPYDDALMYDTVEEPQGPRGRPLIVLLSFVVLAAFAAVVWVAYQQGVREGQRGSPPPILSADTGPTRIAPPIDGTSPAAPEKSLERLSSDTMPPSDTQLMPPAEEPRPLPSPQDVTAAVPPPAAAIMPPTPPGRPDAQHPGLDTTVSPVAPLPQTSGEFFNNQANHAAPSANTTEDLTSGLPPSAITAPTAAPPAKRAKPKPAKPAVSVAPPPDTASQPDMSPGTMAPVPDGEGGPLVPSKPAETQTAMLETPSPAIVAGGSIAIQLGSFPTDLLAAASWSRIKTANVDILGAYSAKFQRAEVAGKGTWYRLQVTGFADKAAAAEVCNKLKANGQDCIITTAK